MKRVAFMELDDPAIDLLAVVKSLGDHRLTMVAHTNPESLLRKMGEIAQVRIGGEAADLRGEPIDVLVVGSGRPELVEEAKPYLDKGSDTLVLLEEEAREYFRDPSAYLRVSAAPASPGNPGSVPPPPIELAYDPEGLTRWILEKGAEAARGESATIFRRGSRGYVRHAESRKGRDRSREDEVKDESFTGRVAKGEVFVLEKSDLDQILARSPKRSPVNGVVFSIPGREAPWGALVVERLRDPGDAADTSIQEFASHLAAIGRTLERATEHARMEGDLRGYALREEMEEILLAAGPLEDRLGQALERFAEMMDADSGAIYLYDATKDRLQVRAMAAPFESIEGWNSYAPGRGLVGRIFRDGEATFFAPSIEGGDDRLEPGRRGLYLVPIPGDPRPGVLALDGCPEPAQAGGKNESVATVVARAFSFAIQHAATEEPKRAPRERRNG